MAKPQEIKISKMHVLLQYPDDERLFLGHELFKLNNKGCGISKRINYHLYFDRNQDISEANLLCLLQFCPKEHAVIISEVHKNGSVKQAFQFSRLQIKPGTVFDLRKQTDRADLKAALRRI